MTSDHHMTEIEVIRNVFRRPRDIVLSLVSEFYYTASARYTDGVKAKVGFDSKPVELLDAKSHVVSNLLVKSTVRFFVRK